jgi:hypothetical protein
MSPLEITLPIVILVLCFLMKLFVDRSPDIPSTIETTYELPIDIIFLALTFAAAFTITHIQQSGRGLFHFAVYVVLAVLIVVMARRSNNLFVANKKTHSAAVFVLNAVVAVLTLVVSMELVTSK